MIFKVVGPFKLHVPKRPGGKAISDKDIDAFWAMNGKYAKRRGCYVFGRRAAKGYIPGYVGKTRKAFNREVFGDHQVNKYNQFITESQKGSPVLFFVLAPKSAGKPNNKKIREVEKYLIDLAMTKNPNLYNKQDTGIPNWGIQGIVRGTKGKVTKGTNALCKMLGIPK
jgi:hypothetical protein